MNHTLNIRQIFLLSLTICISTSAAAQNENILSRFLTSLNQTSLDSAVEIKHLHPNGALKEKLTVMHSHYYAFDIRKDKFLRKTFVKVKEIYNSSGTLIRKDSLAPPEQGYYYENLFDTNGKKKKVIIYEFKGNYQLSIKPDGRVFLPKDYEKISAYSLDKNNNKKSQYTKRAPLRYVAHQRGDLYDITDSHFQGEYRDYPNNRYVTFEPQKKHLEIKITNPANDSVECTLKFRYANGLLSTTKPDEIRDFIIKNTRVYATVPCIALYDQQTKTRSILDYNFEKIIKEPVKSFQVLRRESVSKTYFWICNEKCGLYSLSGKNIIPMKHGSYMSGTGDYLKLFQNGQYSCIDYKGNVIIPYRNDIEGFTIYSDNVASIYTKGFSTKGKRQFYLDLKTGDTIRTYNKNKNPFTLSDQWRNFESSGSLNDFKLIQDTLAFLELRNPKYYGLTGADRHFWWQKYVLKLPDSLQKKTDLLNRYPDFDPVEFKYVLYNLKTNRGDTIKMELKTLAGMPAYHISLDTHSFVNGYARLEIMVAKANTSSYERFYSLLSQSGEIVNVQRRYSKIGDLDSRGQAVVEFKEWRGTDRSGIHIETYGVINADGEEIIPCEYRSCSLVKRHGYRVFTKDAKWGLIDFEGETLVKPDTSYDTIDRMIRKTENPFILTLVIGLK